MRILVTGKNGQVGSEFSSLTQPGCEVFPVGREQCDLSRPESIRSIVRRVKPDVIVNAGAYTAVDLAEKERELCFAVNATAPGVLAQEAAKLGALLIHYSSDYVFNGEKKEPYVECDAIDPLSVYGSSKAAGEAEVAAAAGRYLVLRTSWVYGAQGKNFLRTMLRLGRERAELRIVDDQIGAPTSAAAIAAATSRLAALPIQEGVSPDLPFPSGIYHMTAAGSTSWCGFAGAIFQASSGFPKPRVLAISTGEYPTPARRPQNSILANGRFERTFGFRLGPWQEQLDEVMHRARTKNLGE